MVSPDNAELAINVLLIAMGVIAVFANITAFARVGVCRKALTDNKK
jgi:hypothetical protein